ncbi:hypothetical protein KDH_52290 [Dictyobacter sp. S3.2.2.5]|uniref:Uncharacterized protein n=1 Tax=Dictyobacter halimunensis TaxID=3026934 RepID=A0ABQ6FXP5_9CHLR|nr:hypothetical protein KDH_52290 [Dictyobacter sp. S3.2.2.5]
MIPHAGNSTTDETSNIGPGVSYAYTAVVKDQAGSGMTMYRIWYGVESHLKDKKKPSRLCSARQVWLAVPADAVNRGLGMQVVLGTATKVYGKPEQKSDYQIGDAPQGAIFVSGLGVLDDKNIYWYEINFNHRQAWIPESAVAL